ncbi:CLUMA_CG002967, isoform A [Clunio marinus]|uniref:CLUMA_CG002967, isoform A n=1 Tax=Clunio marinus TaxID=568069 RepID=A0A1J1HMC5_9DIPT|nr:CLUMA_CG002967, isoform A [Clunio marinus]
MDIEEPLDPRIQIELENLNSCTDDINKLEIELEEANATFRILLNESTRRLKLSAKKLGNSIEKSRPYYEALEKARVAQIECQKAAVKFQRANEIHAAAKETVALAEERFMSNSHEWQFDNAWQEMLNHATLKVMDAEKQKADSGADHQEKTQIFHAAESKVQLLEQKFKSSIGKSRPYFEEKQICQDQLNTQKERIQQLQSLLQSAKSNYASSLKNLELISESIHKARGDFEAPPAGIREPGVGAESHEIAAEQQNLDFNLDDVELESRSHSRSASQSRPSEVNENDLEALRKKVKSLAVRPIEGGDGKQDEQESWESELNATVDKLDHLMLLREKKQNFCPEPVSLPQSPDHAIEQNPIKQLKKIDPLPLAIVSLQTLPTSSNASPLNSKIFSGTTTINCDNLIHKKKRKLSLQ